MHHHEREWRATKQRPHQAPKAPHQSHNRRSTDRSPKVVKVKLFLKIALVIIALAALYSTLPSECRGFQSSTFKHCVD